LTNPVVSEQIITFGGRRKRRKKLTKPEVNEGKKDVRPAATDA
jgi:hypothetical protein